MQLTIEKVPEGLKVTLNVERSGKKPTTFIIPPGQIGFVADMLRTAANADNFKFMLDLGK